MMERFQLATENHSRNKNYQFWQYGNNPEERHTNIPPTVNSNSPKKTSLKKSKN